MRRTLIKNAWILSVDPGVGEIKGGDVLVEDDKIVEVRPGIEAGDARVIDASDMVALPGFVDTHRHTWQSLVRGVGCDWTLDHYFQGIRGMAGWKYRPEDVYAGNLIGSLEALNGGITTLLDWSHIQNSPEHSDAAIAALAESGIRAAFGYGNSNAGWQPGSEEKHSHDAKRIREQYFPSDEGRMSMMLALRGPQWTTMDVTEHDFNLARELGVRVTMHVGDGLWGARTKPILALQERSLLGDDTTYVHCNTLLPEEYELIVESGGTVSISAELEMNMGHGYPPTGRFTRLGLDPSLSIDVVDSVGGDMFTAMRVTLAMERALEHQPFLDEGVKTPGGGIEARDVIRFATLEGARACGLDHKVGSLTPGKQADIVLINCNDWNLVPLNDAVGTVVGQANPTNVDTILVEGEVVKRHGKLLTADLPRVRSIVEASRDHLYSEVGVEVGEPWFSEAEIGAEYRAVNR